MLERIIAWTTADWALKLTALALAFLLWTTVRAEAPGQWATDDIEVRVVNNDADWVVADAPTPSVVRVVFRGPVRELLRTASQRPDIVVPVDQVNDSVEVLPLRRNWVRLPPGTAGTDVVSITPDMVRVSFDRVATRLMPVVARFEGSLPSGFEMIGPPEVEPSVVRASGAGRNLARVDTLRLPPIDLRDRRGVDTLDLTIDTVGTGLIISPRTVRVIIPVRPILTDTVPTARIGARIRGG
jgi:YbbR domain-containing protein